MKTYEKILNCEKAEEGKNGSKCNFPHENDNENDNVDKRNHFLKIKSIFINCFVIIFQT